MMTRRSAVRLVALSPLLIDRLRAQTLSGAVSVSGAVTIGSASSNPIYFRTITIASGAVGADLTDFPVPVIISNASMKSIANGGHVQNVGSNNILFYSDSGHTTLLNWEIESYDATNGVLVAWVKRTLATASNTYIYMKYGDPNDTSFQGGAAGSAWESNYQLVVHMADATAPTDSTASPLTLTDTDTTSVAGQVDGGASFNGTSSQIASNDTTKTNATTALTVSAWVYGDSTVSSNYNMIMYRYTGSSGYVLASRRDTTAHFDFRVWTSGVEAHCEGTTNSHGDAWHLVVGVYDGTDVRLYVDGAAEGTPASHTGSVTAGSMANTIGSSGGGNWFKGVLDEVRMATAARSTHWVAAEYNCTKASPTFPTIGGETQ